MPAVTAKTETFPVMRWADQRGHFLAESSVQSEDRLDPGAYYGVSSITWATCKICGRVEEPLLVQVGTVELEIPEL